MRTRAILIAVAVILVAGALVVWKLPRLSPPDEEQIAQLILEVKQGVETKDAGAVLKCISDDYDDKTYVKRDITRMVVGGFRQPEPFSVHIEPPQIVVQGDQAHGHIRARFATGPRMNPSSETNLDVRVEFRKERGRWRVIRATGWEPAATLY